MFMMDFGWAGGLEEIKTVYDAFCYYYIFSQHTAFSK